MHIARAKQQVKDTIEAYLATDEEGLPLLDPSRQRPVFLIGAPGIGKTAIMAQIAFELGIGLVSYSMTHHTRQSALGLPFIQEESYGDFTYQASEYTMSEIIASVYSYTKTSGMDRGILFLDEINCVSETLYPSMLQFLQFKTFGRHKVPDGWVIACAGNPPEYNKSVHEFDIVTLDRVKKIVVEPDYEAWKAYALSKDTHPSILTFLDIKKNRFYSVEASLEGKSFVTARGWDDLSDIIDVFERLGKTVDYDLVVQYVQSEAIAREFAAYYELFNKYREDYRIDDILAGVDVVDVVERAREAAFDERLSLIGLLLDALSGDAQDVMDATDVLIAVRDDLRAVKTAVGDGADVVGQLRAVRLSREAKLEMSLAAGVLSKEKRRVTERVLRMLYDLTVLAEGCEDAADTLAVVESDFTRRVQRLTEHAAGVEERLARAFAFVDEAFGNQQELLVFTTELTSRTVTARYIAHYGSASYFAHNENMIPSERRRDLRHRIEELGL